MERIAASLVSGILLLTVGAISGIFPFGSLRFLLLALLCVCVMTFFYFQLSYPSLPKRLLDAADRFGARFALVGAIMSGLILSISILFLYHGFDTRIDFDLALRNQAFWRFLHGTGFVSTMDAYGTPISNFGVHSAYIYFPMLPIYALFPCPPTLMILQALMAALGGYLLFRCLKARFTSEIAIGITIVYWITVFINGAVFFGVHEITFAPPFIVLMFDSFFKNNAKRFLLWTFVVLSIKETMPFVVVGFVILALIKRRSWVWWAIPGFMAAAFAAFNFGLVFPLLRSGMAHAYMGLDFLPKSPGDWLKIAPLKLRYPFVLASAFLFVGPFTMYALPALPEIAINMVSMNPNHTAFYAHYTIVIAIVFLVSSAVAIDAGSRNRFLSRIAGDSRRAALWLVMVLILSQAVISPMWIPVLFPRDYSRKVGLWKLIRRIPPQATVMASHGFLAALSSRNRVYSFYNTFNRLKSCDYLMIDESFRPSWYPQDAKHWIEGLMKNPDSDSLFQPEAIDFPYVLMRRRCIDQR